jgi:hypothetical protein
MGFKDFHVMRKTRCAGYGLKSPTSHLSTHSARPFGNSVGVSSFSAWSAFTGIPPPASDAESRPDDERALRPVAPACCTTLAALAVLKEATGIEGRLFRPSATFFPGGSPSPIDMKAVDGGLMPQGTHAIFHGGGGGLPEKRASEGRSDPTGRKRRDITPAVRKAAFRTPILGL